MRVFDRSTRALGFLALLVLAGCTRTELLQALDERQANEVVSVLLRHNIDAQKRLQGKDGFVVRVASNDLADAIDLIAQQQLPSQPRTQISAQFPSDAMVSTPLGERARLLSAIEQRLEETLATLDGVQSARVHVSYDAGPVASSLQQRTPPAMHVAAVLAHVQGADEEVLLQRVKRLLRNAFVDVSYDNVSVLLTPAAAARALSVTGASTLGATWQRWLGPVVLLALLGGLGWALIRRAGAARAFIGRRFRRASHGDDHATTG